MQNDNIPLYKEPSSGEEVKAFTERLNAIDDRKIKKHFSLRVRMLQQKRGINTNKEIYDAICIDSSRFSKLIKGAVTPTLMEVLKISTFFNVSVDSLVNPNKHINDNDTWEKYSTRDILGILIELHKSGQLNVVSRECFVDSVEYQKTTTSTFEFLFPANADLDDNYIQTKFEEWLRISEPFSKNEHEYDSETLSMLKKGFLSTADDTKPFYRSNLFGFTDYD